MHALTFEEPKCKTILRSEVGIRVLYDLRRSTYNVGSGIQFDRKSCRFVEFIIHGKVEQFKVWKSPFFIKFNGFYGIFGFIRGIYSCCEIQFLF